MAKRMDTKVKRSAVSRQQVSQMIKSSNLAHMEIKRYSQVTAAYGTNTAGAVMPLTQGLIIGDTVSGRTGDVIMPQRLEINLSIIAPATITTPIVTRFIVLQDRLNTGAAVTVANVLDGGVYNSSYSLLPFQQRRFKILIDKSVASVLGGNNMAQQHELRFKMKGKIFYNGDTNTAAGNGAGSIWLLTVSSGTLGTYPEIAFYSSLTYTDA